MNIQIGQDVYKAIADNSYCAAAACDEFGRVIYSNTAFRAYFGTDTGFITEIIPSKTAFKAIKNGEEIFNDYFNYKGQEFICSSPKINEGGLTCFIINYKGVSNINDGLIFKNPVQLKPFLAAFKEIEKATCSLSGPKPIIITGPSGCGKTTVAFYAHSLAIKSGVFSNSARFTEINCQKFKNPLEAESFIFSSFNEYKHPLLSRCGQCTIFINNPPENILDKVFDLWTNGFFIDSSNFSYNKTQASIILGLLEPTQVENSDTFDIAQITLPSFPSLGLNDRELLFNSFVRQYSDNVFERYGTILHFKFSKEFKEQIINGQYTGNIRQFKKTITYCLDKASPLVTELNKREINVNVDENSIPFYKNNQYEPDNAPKDEKITPAVEKIIDEMIKDGKGPRKISNELVKMGYPIEYYKVAYYMKLKKNKTE